MLCFVRLPTCCGRQRTIGAQPAPAIWLNGAHCPHQGSRIRNRQVCKCHTVMHPYTHTYKSTARYVLFSLERQRRVLKKKSVVIDAVRVIIVNMSYVSM